MIKLAGLCCRDNYLEHTSCRIVITSTKNRANELFCSQLGSSYKLHRPTKMFILTPVSVVVIARMISIEKNEYDTY